jgi:sensor histidine kinase regulating citrate/malate metabolism
MTERAEASEALSTQIVNSLTAGLLVVDREGVVRIINPSGQKMLASAGRSRERRSAHCHPQRRRLSRSSTAALTTGEPIVRRTVEVPHANDVTHSA